MSEIKTLFRFCPECGRRFHIKLVSKNLVDIHREKEELQKDAVVNYSSRYPFASGPPIILQEGEPITIEIEEFQYKYKCKHCGHEWTENHVEEHKEG